MANLKDTTITGTLSLLSSSESDLNIDDVQAKLNEIDSKIENIKTTISLLSKIQFKPFSVIKNSDSGLSKTSTSALLTNLTTLKKYFPNATTYNCGAIIMNGDGNACTVHFDGVTWKGTDLYVVFKDQCKYYCIKNNWLIILLSY